MRAIYHRRVGMITVAMTLAIMTVAAVIPAKAAPLVEIVTQGATSGSGMAGTGSINFLASYSNSASGGIGTFNGKLNGARVSGLFSVNTFATPIGETFSCGALQTVVPNGSINSGNFTGQDFQVTSCKGVNSSVMILIATPSTSLSFSETYFGFGTGTTILQE